MMMDQKLLEQRELAVLESGKWGTIAPYSLSAAKALSERTWAGHALLCHSADAAYEAVLRHLGAALSEAPRGDAVIVGAYSSPALSLVALCVGMEPLFCPTCETCHMMTPRALEDALAAATVPVRAVVIDYLAEHAESQRYPLDRISEICRAHRVPLLLYAGGCIGARHRDVPLTAYADAVWYSLGEGSAVDAGGGGLLTTDWEALWAGAFAYHNCGRAIGAGSSLVMDHILGGDMRVTEWVAAAAQEILEQNALRTPTPRTMAHMQGQPVFADAYAQKMLGRGQGAKGE